MCKEQPLFILGIYWVEPPLPVIESLILKPELRTFLGDSLTFHTFWGDLGALVVINFQDIWVRALVSRFTFICSYVFHL